MTKVKFEILEMQVEKMFQNCLKISDYSILERKFLEIREFILGCGWSEDDYIARQLGFISKELNELN